MRKSFNEPHYVLGPFDIGVKSIKAPGHKLKKLKECQLQLMQRPVTNLIKSDKRRIFR